MAYVIIPSEERKQQAEYVLKSFGQSSQDKSAREYADCIAARTREVMEISGGKRT